MKKIKHILILIFIVGVYGCSSHAKMENLIYSESDSGIQTFEKDLMHQISLAPAQISPEWSSQISTGNFSEAVKKSLSSHDFFSDIGKYKLEIFLLKVDKRGGLDINSTTNVRYVLTNSKDNSVLIDETVKSDYTATFHDAHKGSKRGVIAIEGSSKKNIRELIIKLSQIDLTNK